MNRRTALALLASGLLAPVYTPQAMAKDAKIVPINWDPTGRKVYWFEPHQDDGSLFMAQAVAHHVLANREVHVVLMSNGNASSARGEINGTAVDTGWWGSPVHDPAREGYAPLGLTEFGLARTREWRQAWIQLGVPPERQHFGMGLASSDLLPTNITTAYATDVMRYWVQQDLNQGLPAPSLKTMWWGDTTTDHANCGAALRALRLSNDTHYADAQWMVRTEQRGVTGSQQYAVPAAMLAEVQALQERSGWCYCAWAPEQGMYAIGRHSVSDLLDSGPLAHLANWIVKNP